jgi:Raf kinase inhibitor-like YbhB/YbcL family protein
MEMAAFSQNRLIFQQSILRSNIWERGIMVHSDTFPQILLAALAWALFLTPTTLAVDPRPDEFKIELGFEKFPLESTCDGRDVSPQIEIKGCNASSLAIILEDPDAPSGIFTHWVIWNIQPTTTIPPAIAREDVLSDLYEARQGTNDFGEIGYVGPCPPSGRPHRYFFRVYGLDGMLDLPAGASAAELRQAMQGHIQQQGQATARFGR